MKTNFNNYDWHDTIVESIVIDRNNPGINDTVKFNVIWPNSVKNIILLTNVYWASFNMNFGVVSPETLFSAHVSTDDQSILNLKKQWKGQLDKFNLNCFVFEFNSTNSLLKIIAEDFTIL